MTYRIVELRRDIGKFIEFDRKISWDFVSEEVKRSLSFSEYSKRHRRLIEEIFSRNIENKVFVALDDENKVVGAAWVGIKMDSVDYVPTCYVYDLEVSEEARGQGIGSSFLKAIEDFCLKRGILRIGLTTPLGNVDAVKWYLKRGFKIKRLYLEKNLER